MAFLRFARDKRGVESFALVHATTNRRGKVRPRVLYWFRSPPDIKVGREPFDQELRRALEKQYPDITFDWRAIVETPIPSADADKWRERRRAERAAKHAAAAEESADVAGHDETAEEAVPAPDVGADTEAASPSVDAAQPSVAVAGPAAPVVPRSGDANRKRRRRRRSGGGRGGQSPSPGGAAAPSPPSGGDPSGE